jgi:glycosyltransferase involved in cell wall biosynthesis
VKILVLSQFYPPVQGGEEQSARNLSTHLASRGHDVLVVTLAVEGLPARELADGVRIQRVRGTLQRARRLFTEPGRRHAPPFPDPELVAAVWRVIALEQPDVVHAHNWLGFQYLPLKLLARVPFVVSLHDMSLVCAVKNFMYHDQPCGGPGIAKCLECSARHYGPAKGMVTAALSNVMNGAERRLVDLFLPVSMSCAEGNGLVGSGIAFEVLPNILTGESDGDAADQVRYADYIAQLPQTEFILFVGGLRRIKGLEFLLRAYADLKSAPPLVLIGYDCPDTPKEWPPYVTVLKNWPHGAVMRAWRRSMLGVVPSICQETFGLVALEAMTAGKPVIASRIGGLPEVVVDGETGLLVEPANARALTAALERLIACPSLRAQMGAAGRARSDQFRPAAIVPRLESVYQGLVQDRTRRRSARDVGADLVCRS